MQDGTQGGEPNYWGSDEDNEVYSDVPEQPVALLPQDSIAWQASEYLQYNNGAWWYFGFILVAIILILVAIFLNAWTFIPLVIVMAIAGIIHVRRPPRVVQYILDDSGLQIDGRLHPYTDFKSFSVIRDGGLFAILLVPSKRFAPSTIVYFDEADGEAIVDAFGTRLPMENRGLDVFDQFLRIIRF